MHRILLKNTKLENKKGDFFISVSRRHLCLLTNFSAHVFDNVFMSDRTNQDADGFHGQTGTAAAYHVVVSEPSREDSPH